ncbi:MAG: hypothetical protein JWM61_91 [Micrococcaceae bacterium]|nr:hypothetical protein [Micrococcaceae bacterium]
MCGRYDPAVPAGQSPACPGDRGTGRALGRREFDPDTSVSIRVGVVLAASLALSALRAVRADTGWWI